MCCTRRAAAKAVAEAAAVTWWRDSRDFVAPRIGDVPLLLVLFADCNCKLGSVTSPAIGPVEAEAQSRVGAACHETLLELGVALLPSSLVAGRWGCASSPSGIWHRVEYVGIPMDLVAAVTRTGWLPEHVLAIEEKVVHVAPYVDVMWAAAEHADAHAPPRRCWFERHALGLPEVQA